MISVHDVAAYLLRRQRGMTAMKLQRILYYAQAWSLVWDKAPLFSERIEAWANGPVIPDLYARHRGQAMVRHWDGDPTALSPLQRETVEAVLRFYGRHSLQWLTDLTRREQPWETARRGMPIGVRGTRVIPLTALAAYYGGLPPDPATVLASLQRVTRALRLLYERTGIIDNSTCALCGRQRLWPRRLTSGA